MNYLEWNNRLAQYYFNEEMAGREVLLYTNKEVITSIGEGLGDVADFINAVKTGPPWVTRTGLCQKALQACEDWRRRKFDFPPYIAFLVLFVLAEDAEGDFAPHAYYPRLNQLLGEDPNAGRPPSFDRTITLWDDLEKWSKEDKHEELGRFTARIRGGWINVGLPLSQTILSREERDELPIIFSEAELDPTDFPPIDILRKMLIEYGSRYHILRRRTVRILEGSDSENRALKNALLEFVLEELSEWDGTSPEIVTSEKSVVGESKAGLRLCLHEDSLAKKITSYLRFKTNRTIPDTGLNFQCPNYEIILTCSEASANWSSKIKIKDQVTSKLSDFDASVIDWVKGLSLKDTEYNWHAKLKGANVRLFLPGKREGFSDWIESHHLERQSEFLIAVHLSVVDVIRNWGSQFCENFQEKTYLGLPSGWFLFYGKNAVKSCDNLDVLNLSDLLRSRLVGGIKTGRGNTYLKFSLPSVMLENMSGIERVKINGVEISRDDQNIPVWELRGEFPLYEPLRIEVYGDSPDPLQTRIIKIEDPHIQTAFDDAPKRGPDGRIAPPGSDSYALGAMVIETSKKECAMFSTALPTHLSSRMVFLGARPGEIKDWPSEELPLEWHPVWAVAKEGQKQWVVHFCGNSLQMEDHFPGKPLSDSRSVKRWREAIWVNRKICQLPSLFDLTKLWKIYLEAAKNA